MFIFPLIFITSFIVALRDVYKGKGDGILIFLIFGSKFRHDPSLWRFGKDIFEVVRMHSAVNVDAHLPIQTH